VHGSIGQLERASAPLQVHVHGAFADGSGWTAVAKILERDGFKVSIAQPPETSLDDDVAATSRTIDAMGGPVVLVGHSYGGIIITAAGNNEHVKSLVYVAAFQPDTGESLGSLSGQQATGVIGPEAFTGWFPVPGSGHVSCRFLRRPANTTGRLYGDIAGRLERQIGGRAGHKTCLEEQTEFCDRRDQ
jgi:pimeloyl-ACP methyl ester carboxylesterase